MQQNNNKCPICKANMLLDSENRFCHLYEDYVCRSADHFLAIRSSGDQMVKIKIRLQDEEKDNYFIKINYDLSTTEVWKNSNEVCKNTNSVDRSIVIDRVSKLELYSRNKILNKIKSILLFS